MQDKSKCLVMLFVYIFHQSEGYHDKSGLDYIQGRNLLQSQDYLELYTKIDDKCKDEVMGSAPRSSSEAQKDCSNIDPYDPVDSSNCFGIEIFNPIPAPEGRYPYFVSLQQRLQEGSLVRFRHFCGGALITKNILITAAHCIWSSGEIDFRDTEDSNGNGVLSKDRVFVALGPYCRHQKGIERLVATEFFMHPSYNGFPWQSDDIILIKVEKPFDYSGPFPDFQSAKNFVYEQDDVIITAMGHGAQNLNEASAGDIDFLGKQVAPLGLAFLKFHPNEQCDKEVKRASSQLTIIPEKMVCFENINQDTCAGDAGSPVIMADGTTFGVTPFDDPSKDMLVGLTSWGPDLDCNGAGLPGVYTRLGNYVDWINEILENQQNQVSPSKPFPPPEPQPAPYPPTPISNASTPSKVEQEECMDTQPPGIFTCSEIIQNDWCGDIENQYCAISCGFCCFDEEPSDFIDCNQIVQQGRCQRVLKDGKCRKSCGACSAEEENQEYDPWEPVTVKVGESSVFENLELADSLDLPDYCLLEADGGPGEGVFNHWFYNADAKECQQFFYGGFMGNKNNFRTKDECEESCTNSP